MTTITGDCGPYLAVLGLADDDAAVQAIMEQQKGKAKTQTFKGPFVHYVSYYKSGVGFAFDKQGLKQVSFTSSPAAASTRTPAGPRSSAASRTTPGTVFVLRSASRRRLAAMTGISTRSTAASCTSNTTTRVSSGP